MLELKIDFSTNGVGKTGIHIQMTETKLLSHPVQKSISSGSKILMQDHNL
jgi:hypothetical protein